MAALVGGVAGIALMALIFTIISRLRGTSYFPADLIAAVVLVVAVYFGRKLE